MVQDRRSLGAQYKYHPTRFRKRENAFTVPAKSGSYPAGRRPPGSLRLFPTRSQTLPPYRPRGTPLYSFREFGRVRAMNNNTFPMSEERLVELYAQHFPGEPYDTADALRRYNRKLWMNS